MCLIISSVPPSIEDSANEVAATSGSRALLECDAMGMPTPTVTWKKDGNDIPSSGSRYAMQRTGSLQFSRVLIEDSGVYECIAENEAGVARKEITLVVQGKTQHCKQVLYVKQAADTKLRLV
jgi:hypothetical protein